MYLADPEKLAKSVIGTVLLSSGAHLSKTTVLNRFLPLFWTLAYIEHFEFLFLSIRSTTQKSGSIVGCAPSLPRYLPIWNAEINGEYGEQAYKALVTLSS